MSLQIRRWVTRNNRMAETKENKILHVILERYYTLVQNFQRLIFMLIRNWFRSLAFEGYLMNINDFTSNSDKNMDRMYCDRYANVEELFSVFLK